MSIVRESRRIFFHPKSWYIELLAVAGILGMMMGITGAYWDVGWHFDYGRDTFWSPPHLLIYGNTVLAAIFFTLNFIVALIHDLPHKRHALFVLMLFGLASVGITFLSAPIDQLWHRLYGIDVQIISLPHLMLIFGGIAGGLMIMSILRYHILHERHRFLLEKILIPVFLGGALAGLILVFAESEFTTLPLWHPVQNRPLWVYPIFSLLFGLFVFIATKYVSTLRWAATLTLAAYVILRTLPIINNSLWGMKSVPIVPPFLLILLAMALVIDALFSRMRRLRAR